MKYRIVERVVDGVGLYVVQGGFDDCEYKNIGQEYKKLSEAYTAIRNLKYNAGEKYEEGVYEYVSLSHAPVLLNYNMPYLK